MRFRRSGRTTQLPPPSGSGSPPEPIAEVLKDLLEELQRRKEAGPPRRDWVQTLVTALPGLIAGVALIFTWLSISATTKATNDQLQTANHQLNITEQGQVTDRYTTATTDLGSSSVDVRLGGIYALQRIMQDSPRDQSTIVAVLCAFVRDHTNTSNTPTAPSALVPEMNPGPGPSTDVQAALTVIGARDTSYDSSATVVDFNDKFIAKADLSNANLAHANLQGTNLASANFAGADLSGASFGDGPSGQTATDLVGANFQNANLSNVFFVGSWLDFASFDGANLSDSTFPGMDLSNMFFQGANLSGAILQYVNLSGAKLDHANLTGADLRGANLTGADLTGADSRRGSHGRGSQGYEAPGRQRSSG